MLIDCPEMTSYRNSCSLGSFISAYLKMQPQISSIKIYALYLNDSKPETMHKKALDLYHMKLGWYRQMNITI